MRFGHWLLMRGPSTASASLRDGQTSLRMTAYSLTRPRTTIPLPTSPPGPPSEDCSIRLMRSSSPGPSPSIVSPARWPCEHRRSFSSKYHCIRLVYYESFDDVHKAIGREKQLKGWSRAKKIALIESRNPRWEDMAEKWGAELLFAGESMNKLSS